jgi:hypothetical protein
MLAEPSESEKSVPGTPLPKWDLETTKRRRNLGVRGIRLGAILLGQPPRRPDWGEARPVGGRHSPPRPSFIGIAHAETNNPSPA